MTTAAMTTSAMITDAHLHVWDTGRLHYEWLDDAPALNRPHLPSESRAPEITRAVFVQADALDGEVEARWVQALAPEWPELAGIVAFAPVERPELEAQLDRLAVLPLFVGVRRLLQDESPGFIGSAEFVRGLTVLAERGIPFDACVRHHQLLELAETVERVPSLRIVLDHLGKPPVAEGLDSDAGVVWLDALERLARHPGASVKLSGLSPEADPARPLREQVQPFLEAALECFGPERSMLGSDWPVSANTPHRLATAEWIELVADLVPDPAERASVLDETAGAFYGLRADRRSR